MYFKYPIIDTHIHVGDIEEINKAVKKAEYEQYVLLSGSVAPKMCLGQSGTSGYQEESTGKDLHLCMPSYDRRGCTGGGRAAAAGTGLS